MELEKAGGLVVVCPLILSLRRPGQLSQQAVVEAAVLVLSGASPHIDFWADFFEACGLTVVHWGLSLS